MAPASYKRTAHRWRLLALMLFAVFCAFGSFWLVQVMQGEENGPGFNAGNEPDYIVDNFSWVRMSEAGKPRYVMGVGTPSNLLNLIGLGIDMFDCVLPTRNARNGTVYTWDGALHYKAARHAQELDEPLDRRCGCYTCRHFTRGYLHHLHRVGEILGAQLNTIHNLHYYLELMGEIRDAIETKTFDAFRKRFHDHRARGVD